MVYLFNERIYQKRKRQKEHTFIKIYIKAIQMDSQCCIVKAFKEKSIKTISDRLLGCDRPLIRWITRVSSS